MNYPHKAFFMVVQSLFEFPVNRNLAYINEEDVIVAGQVEPASLVQLP